MEADWWKFPARKRPRIEMLKSSAWWDSGERFTLTHESEKELYFDDSYDGTAYVEKSKEGIDFVYLRHGKLEQEGPKPFTRAQVIARLRTLADKWPDHLMLFAANGALLLVDENTLEVYCDFPGIHCDGGDPQEVHEVDKRFLEL